MNAAAGKLPLMTREDLADIAEQQARALRMMSPRELADHATRLADATERLRSIVERGGPPLPILIHPGAAPILDQIEAAVRQWEGGQR